MVKNPDFEKKVRRAPNGEFTDKPGAGSSGVSIAAEKGLVDYMSAPMSAIAADQVENILDDLGDVEFDSHDGLYEEVQERFENNREQSNVPYFEDPHQARQFIDAHKDDYEKFLSYWESIRPGEYSPDTYDNDNEVTRAADEMIASYTYDTLTNGNIFTDIEEGTWRFFEPEDAELALKRAQDYTPRLTPIVRN